MSHSADASDTDLLSAVRAGDDDAFGHLWKRHYPSAVAAARAITSDFDADDLAQEAFAAVLRVIRQGGGPHTAFRTYVLTAVRNLARQWGRRSREVSADDLDDVVDSSAEERADSLDRSIIAQAFRALPERWQEVLWYTEVEQLKPAAIAPLLSLTPVAVAQLAFRAREGLREAWISAHLSTLSCSDACAWVVQRLGAYSRNNVSRRDRAKIDDHLVTCVRCPAAAEEAAQIGRRIAVVIAPLVLGGGAAAYLAAAAHTAGVSVAAAAGIAAPSPRPRPRLASDAASTVGRAGFASGATAAAAAVTGAAILAGGAIAWAVATGHPGAGTSRVDPAASTVVSGLDRRADGAWIEPPDAQPSPGDAAPDDTSAPRAPVAPSPEASRAPGRADAAAATPTAEPTPRQAAPAATPTAEPAPAPTVTPTAAPTVAPAPTATPTPTASSSPTPSDPPHPVDPPSAAAPEFANVVARLDGTGRMSIEFDLVTEAGATLSVGIGDRTVTTLQAGVGATVRAIVRPTLAELLTDREVWAVRTDRGADAPRTSMRLSGLLGVG